MAEYKYHLAKWSERNKKLLCPNCHKAGCYKEYVYADGTPIDPEGHTVGKCDHETHCGYHVTPKEWFANGGRIDTPAIVINRPKPKRIEIPYQYVEDYYQNTIQNGNVFLDWVQHLPLTDTQRQQMAKVIESYAIGTAKDSRIIWWQIDENRIVRTGKLMKYDTTGHRCKNENGDSIGFGWVHSMMQTKLGLFPAKKRL